MANQEHVDILRQGVDEWNYWRTKHPEIKPDLSRLDLSGAHLSRADFCDANLHHTSLSYTDLDFALFRRAILSNANLYSANLTYANLSDAILSQAFCKATILNKAYLRNADFTEATFDSTVFADNDLSIVKGLETVTHIGPSTIGIDTIYQSGSQIPEAFLRGCGLPDTFITFAKSLISKAFEYYSAFISYSSKNTDIAERLHADLQAKGVRCWFAPEDIKIGDPFRQRIDEAIRLHDKLMLILSAESVASNWVAAEVEAALEREDREKRLVLFPVRIDDAVEQSDTAWAALLRRTRHIGDFSQWKDPDSYSKAFARLLRDLKA